MREQILVIVFLLTASVEPSMLAKADVKYA